MYHRQRNRAQLHSTAWNLANRRVRYPVRQSDCCYNLHLVRVAKCLNAKDHMVPHLVTALNGPLLDLERKILDATPGHRTLVPARMAGAHAAVLLLGRSAQRRVQARAGRHQSVSRRFQQSAAGNAAAGGAGGDGVDRKISARTRKNLLLIPERHTRNAFYLQNVARLIADHAPGRPAMCASARSTRTSTDPMTIALPTAENRAGAAGTLANGAASA